MAQMLRCPLTGGACGKSIGVVEKTFFLAEPEKPEEDRKRRCTAIREAFGEIYDLRSALEEERPYAFTCKICEMIQCCAYGIADITTQNPNVILELGIMIALGKPTIILCKRREEGELKLPADLRAIGVIPFEDYIDILDPLRQMTANLPPPLSPLTPIAEIAKLSPNIVEELNKKLDTVVKEFERLIKEAKLEAISPREERIEIPLEIAEELGKREESLRSFDKLGLTMDADTALYRGNLHYERQEYAAALEQYNWCLTLKPDLPEAIYNRGTTYGKMERYDEALADYNRSLELRPDYPETLSNRGATYDSLKRYDEALADYNRALELRPDHPEILSNRGLTYDSLKRYEEALADYNRSLELRPDYPGTLNNRGLTYRNLDRYDEALADYNRALELRPDYPEILNSRGVTYLIMERYVAALADFNRTLQLKPDHPPAVYNMACLFSLWRKPEEAISYLEKAIGLDEKYRQDAATDSDFDNIRDDPRFKKLIEGD